MEAGIVGRSGHHHVCLRHKCLVDDDTSGGRVGDRDSSVGPAEGWSSTARSCIDESQE